MTARDAGLTCYDPAATPRPSGRRALTILEPGPLATVQDEGRPGYAAIGVTRSGACDRAAYRLANRLLGNPPGAAVVEVTHGGFAFRAEGDLVMTTTGAPCPGAPYNAPELVRAGQVVRLGVPWSGLRTYVGVRGGVDVPPVLGSRSADVLSGLGPAPLRAGDVLTVGAVDGPGSIVDVAPVAAPAAGEVTVRVVPGPRRDWFSPQAWEVLLAGCFQVTSHSNRVGVRLQGAPLAWAREDELPSEGLLRGAIQVPPGGQPVLFLADHPVTGGYPVIAYVTEADVDRCAQLRPGQQLRFATCAGAPARGVA